MAKLKYGKLASHLLVVSILSTIILSVVNWILSSITPPTSLSGLYPFLIAVASVAFFMFALRINPGKEEFLDAVPVVIMALAIVGLVRTWIDIIPALSLEFTWSSIAFGLGSVYLATAITKKYILS